MKTFTQLAALSLAAALTVPAYAQQKNAAGPDAKAMKDLAQGNLAEIQAGKLAASKAESPEVKQFGQRMVDDHSKMLEDLKKMAEAKNVQLPTEPKSKDAKKIQKLQGLSGEKFDREYMSEMVKDHKKDVKETADIAKKAKDSEFKSAVQDAHDKMADHLKSAQQIAKDEKSEKRAGSGGTSPAKQKQQ